MSTVLYIVLIQIIICFIVDLSGIIQSIETGCSKLFHWKFVVPKPFSCSLCMGWWINLVYLIVIHQFTLPYIVAVAMTAFFAKNISGFIRWISELLIKIENLLYKIIR